MACVVGLAHAASATTVVELYSGVISGASTIDTQGLFGPKGADLSGKVISIRTRYETTDLAQKTRCQDAPDCTFDSSRSAGDAMHAVRNVVTVNGQTQTYVPTRYADVFFRNSGGYRIVTETDVFDGQTVTNGPGSQVSVYFKNKVVFGRRLSPDNSPVHNMPDFVGFFSAGNRGPMETLTFLVMRAGG